MGRRPVDGALVLVAQQPEALQEALPEVLEQRPVDGLQAVPGRSIHGHVQLCDGLQIPAWHPCTSQHLKPRANAASTVPLFGEYIMSLIRAKLKLSGQCSGLR